MTSAQWLRDPSGRYELRYWNGDLWTDDVADMASRWQGKDALTASYAPPVSLPSQPLEVEYERSAQARTVVVESRGNAFAVTALVLGIVGTVTGLIPILFIFALACGLLAFVFGLSGRRLARKNPARSGKKMALAGTILGVIAIGLGGAGIAIVTDATNDLQDDFEQIDRDLDRDQRELDQEIKDLQRDLQRDLNNL